LSFDGREEMCKALLRFQEHYESPKFRNKIFTLKEFKEWYPKSKGLKKFTYYKDWNGFNFPSYILKPFHAGKFTKLTAAEKKILKTFRTQKDKFYVIATTRAGDIMTLNHEIAHGLFYLDKQYKSDTTFIVKSLKKKHYDQFVDSLKTLGYDKSVYIDEIQAYMISDPVKKMFPIAQQKKAVNTAFQNKVKELNIKI
jgi:hypothetical protein